jgi:hypothetical protein
MTPRSRFSARRAAALLALAGASSAHAQDTVLKNDRFPDDVTQVSNVQLSVQAGFDAGEIAAAILPVPASLRPPIRVKSVQIAWYSTLSSPAAPVVAESIRVYEGSVLQPNAFLVFDSAVDGNAGDGLNPQMQDGGLNNFDLLSENIVINSRPQFITVGLEFQSNTDQSSGPSIVSDRPPNNPQFQTPGRNAIFGTWPLAGINSPQWFEPRIVVGSVVINGVSGNFFIRAIVSGTPCTADIAGAGATPDPDGELTADDIIVFIARFTSGNVRADIARPGPAAGPDGELTADDIIFFVQSFVAGCS